MRQAFCAVVLAALACLLIRASRLGMAGDYVDPIGKLGAQDESLYAHSAIQMALHGNWLTPTFMGRPGLYKPPILAAAAGFSARIFGISRLALRLPVTLLAALSVGFVFWWGAEFHSWQAGAIAAALLLSNHLWFSLGSMCLTDGVLAGCYVAAMFCLFVDPWLESKSAFWGFCIAVAGGVLTKGIAGLPPLAVLGLYWILAPRNQRPTFLRVILAGVVSLALAAPWFLYQMAAHSAWFWAEHLRVEVLGYGAGAPPQTSQENHLVFYGMRLALLDPILFALAFAAVTTFIREVRRSAAGILLLLWITVPLGAAMFWQYRNATYLLPAIPALAILAGAYNPLCTGKTARWVAAVLAIAFAGKVVLHDQPWGLSFASGTRVADAPAISRLCDRGRGNPLVLVESSDEFYATLLPFSQVRYALAGSLPKPNPYGLDFPSMGIILDGRQFADLDRWTPEFERNLRAWGINSDAPIGSVIFVSSADEIAAIVKAHPESDFFLPDRFQTTLAQAASTHVLITESPGRLVLLSRQTLPGPAVRWSCHL